MVSFYEMLRILEATAAVNEIAVNPALQAPAQPPSPRRGSANLVPAAEAQRIIPLVLPRKAVKALMGLHMPVAGAEEVLDRMVSEDDDPSRPVLLSYVSNSELNSLSTLASRIMRWAASHRNDVYQGVAASDLERFADQMFDALQRAQDNAVNGPAD